MLIIFDLDDTLIETSEALIPFRFEQFLARYPIEEKDFLLDRFLSLYREGFSSREILKVWMDQQKWSLEKQREALQELVAPLPPSCSVPLKEGVQLVLDSLRPHHDLALVTAGDEELQKQKMKKAGLDPTIFSRIEVCPSGEKRDAYCRALEKTGWAATRTWVCGDRVEGDLKPAYELAMHTIHMRRKGEKIQEKVFWVDWEIERMEELLQIFPQKGEE